MKTTDMTETNQITVDASKKENRLPWWKRMGSMGCDLFLIAIAYSLVNTVFTIEKPIFVTMTFVFISYVYYVYFEIKHGRTPGKMLARGHFYTVKGKKPTIFRYILRNALRCMGPLALISWNRCSFLDLCSGCRIIQTSLTPVVEKNLPPTTQGWR
jgi:uncharacterized RDD family membrane protein YckC